MGLRVPELSWTVSL
jgi:hypothetical protein